MVDREELAKRHRTIVRSTLLTSVVPLALLAVAWLSQGPPRQDNLLAGSSGTVMLIFSVIALAAPFGAFALRRLMYRLPPVPQIGDSSGQPGMPAIAELSGAEYAMWTLPSLLGFVAVMRGAPWAFFFGALLLTAIGFVFSFPRWSTWSAVADAYDSRWAAHRTSASTDASWSVH